MHQGVVIGISATVGGAASFLLTLTFVRNLVPEAFKRGLVVARDAMEEIHDRERRTLMQTMLSSRSADISRFAQIMVEDHYLCEEGCTEDHRPEGVAVKAQ
jgi:hypothetical protein